jgi:hypothetical protein
MKQNIAPETIAILQIFDFMTTFLLSVLFEFVLGQRLANRYRPPRTARAKLGCCLLALLIEPS